MLRSELYPGLQVEDAYDNKYYVVSTATWKRGEYSLAPFTKYTFMGDEYNVRGTIEPRGRYVLVRDIKRNHGVLKRPSDLNPLGTYKQTQFDNYVRASNNRIRVDEKREVLYGTLRAFWGDAYTVVMDKFKLSSTNYYWEDRVRQAIEYGKIHYAVGLLNK